MRFAAEEHAKQAVEQFHGREVAGRALRLDIAEERPRPPRQRRDFSGPSPNRGRNDSGGRGRPEFAQNDRGQPDEYTRDDYARDRYEYDRDDRDEGPRGGRSQDKPKRPKGSRRGLRGKKRSL